MIEETKPSATNVCDKVAILTLKHTPTQITNNWSVVWIQHRTEPTKKPYARRKIERTIKNYRCYWLLRVAFEINKCDTKPVVDNIFKSLHNHTFVVDTIVKINIFGNESLPKKMASCY